MKFHEHKLNVLEEIAADPPAEIAERIDYCVGVALCQLWEIRVLLRSLARLVALLLVGMVRHPVTTAVFTVAVTTRLVGGLLGLAILCTATVDLLVLWRRRWPGSYRRSVVSRWRAALALDGVREPVRVRAAYVSDDDLAHLVETCGTPHAEPVAAIAEARSA